MKLQFRKIKRRYKRKTYQYERVSLHFPKETTATLQPLRHKKLKITVTKQDGIYTVLLTESS